MKHLVFALNLFGVNAQSGAMTNPWAKGNNICGTAIGDWASPPKVFACRCGSDTKCEAHGVMTTSIGVFGCLAAPWAKDIDGITECTPPASVIPATRRFFMGKDLPVTGADGTGKYAMITDGISFGVPTSYFYLGQAYYIVQEGNFKFNTNSFIVPNAAATGTDLFTTCVIPTAGATESSFPGDCGEKRDVTAGTMKFAVYGGGWYGTEFSQSQGRDEGGGWLANLVCHKGYGSDNSKVWINGKAFSTVVDTTEQVKTLEFGASASSSNGTRLRRLTNSSAESANYLRYKFPQKYLYGQNSACVDTRAVDLGPIYGSGREWECPKNGAYTVKIRVAEIPKNLWFSDLCAGEPGFIIVYGFKGIGHNDHFVYDPEVTTEIPESAQTPKTGGSRYSACLSFMTMAFAMITVSASLQQLD